MNANGHSIHNFAQEHFYFSREGVARGTPERHYLTYMPKAIRNGSVDHIPKRKFGTTKIHLQVFHISVTVPRNYGAGFLNVFECGFSKFRKRFILGWQVLVSPDYIDDHGRQSVDVFQGFLARACLRAWLKAQIYGA